MLKVFNPQTLLKVNVPRLIRQTSAVLSLLEVQAPFIITVTLLDNIAMKETNIKLRNVHKTTDVLSVSYKESVTRQYTLEDLEEGAPEEWFEFDEEMPDLLQHNSSTLQADLDLDTLPVSTADADTTANLEGFHKFLADQGLDASGFELSEGDELESIESAEDVAIVHGDDHLGDIYLGVEYIEQYCRDRGDLAGPNVTTTLEQQLPYYIVHGALHLLGHDHVSDADFAIMREREIWVMKELHKLGHVDAATAAVTT
jgi:rRNA maturation RNase YbeY